MEHISHLSPAWRQWRANIDLDDYDRRFADMEQRGESVHGEADAVARLIDPPATVIDGGTGTGRIAVELARRGFATWGVDYDPDMLARAERRNPDVRWVEGDLATVRLDAQADLVLLGGNLVVFIQPDTGSDVIANMAAHLRPGGYLVAGFTTEWATSPTVPEFRSWLGASGLESVGEFATWDGDPYRDGTYLVSVSRRPRS